MKTLFSLPVRGSAELGAFDPALPLDGSLVVADVLRSQFNGLAGMIAALPSVISAQVDGVETLNPGQYATAAAVLLNGVIHLNFGIPQGLVGPEGPEGPPFAQAVVDSTSTLPPGSQATVGVYFDGTDVHFTFGIPAGGVSELALESAIAGTSANSDAVAPLNMAVSDPPTQAEVQSLANKVDELILALRR
jgi:hypothetical protein